MRLLIVEDDKSLGMFLQRGLRLEGHDVEWVADGDHAVEKAMACPPDLIVLDLGLPRRDGREVLEAVQAMGSNISVLVLTGRGYVEERVRCLNIGADDFLQKPFSFHELSARCRAILRRRSSSAQSTLRFGELMLDRLERKVERNGVAVELTGKEFALLEYLMMRRGQVCDRAELLRNVWQMLPDSNTNVVDVYINYLRRKLASADAMGLDGSPVIETLRGAGYRVLEHKPLGQKRPPQRALPGHPATPLKERVC